MRLILNLMRTRLNSENRSDEISGARSFNDNDSEDTETNTTSAIPNFRLQ